MYLSRLIYYSRNAIPESEKPLRAELKSILDACQRNNPPLGVSGALLFNDSIFAQVLEGDRKAITDTFCRISADPRHSDLIILEARPITQRRFASWSMGFVGAPVAEEIHRRYCVSNQFNPAKMSADSLLGFMSVSVLPKSAGQAKIAFEYYRIYHTRPNFQPRTKFVRVHIKSR